jgi:integrase
MKKEETKHRGVYEHPKESGIYWIHFHDAQGRRHREKCGRKSIAIARYQQRKTQVREGRFFPIRFGPSVAALKEELFQNYRVNNQNLEPIETSWKRLEPVFGAARAESITTEKLNRYIEAQSDKGYANGSINRDMACLKRMFRLATRSTPPKVRQLPIFPPRLREAAPRSGFVVDAQYRALMNQPAEYWLRAFVAMAYKFGFRKQELLSMRVGQIDLPAGVIRLNPGTTKNDEGRIAPMTREIRELLAECVRNKDSANFVFTRGNKPVIDFRGAWEALTNAAGVSGLLVHDLRRSAVRNMIRRGIPEKVAMAISGHKTREVFDRYNIVSETDIHEAGRKLEDVRTATRTAIGVPRGTKGVYRKLRRIN